MQPFFRRPKFIPVILHILAGYDAHFLIKNLNLNSSGNGNGKIDCIPKTEEKLKKYIISKSISENSDSKNRGDKRTNLYIKLGLLTLNFMSTSQDKLVNNMRSKKINLNIHSKHLKIVNSCCGKEYFLTTGSILLRN